MSDKEKFRDSENIFIIEFGCIVAKIEFFEVTSIKMFPQNNKEDVILLFFQYLMTLRLYH